MLAAFVTLAFLVSHGPYQTHATSYLSFSNKEGFVGRVASEVVSEDVGRAKTGNRAVTGPYTIEMPFQTIEAFADTQLNKGELIHFTLKKEASGIFLKPLMPSQVGRQIPQAVQQFIQKNGSSYSPALHLAVEQLNRFSKEGWYHQAVNDFTHVIASSGLVTSGNMNIQNAIPDGLPFNYSVPKRDLPLSAELQVLLQNMARFPVDTSDPILQAHIWRAAALQPFGLVESLNAMGLQPEESSTSDKTLLNLGSPFIRNRHANLPARWFPAGRFTLENLHHHFHQLSLQPDSDPQVRSMKFLLEGVIYELSQEREIQSGESFATYIQYRGKWHGIRLRWADAQSAADPDNQEQLSFSIETMTDNLGKSIIDTTILKDKANLHFQHEKGQVMPFFEAELAQLEARLSRFDFKVGQYQVSRLIEKLADRTQNNLFPPPGPELDKGNLDLKA